LLTGCNSSLLVCIHNGAICHGIILMPQNAPHLVDSHRRPDLWPHSFRFNQRHSGASGETSLNRRVRRVGESPILSNSSRTDASILGTKASVVKNESWIENR